MKLVVRIGAVVAALALIVPHVAEARGGGTRVGGGGGGGGARVGGGVRGGSSFRSSGRSFRGSSYRGSPGRGLSSRGSSSRGYSSRGYSTRGYSSRGYTTGRSAYRSPRTSDGRTYAAPRGYTTRGSTYRGVWSARPGATHRSPSAGRRSSFRSGRGTVGTRATGASRVAGTRRSGTTARGSSRFGMGGSAQRGAARVGGVRSGTVRGGGSTRQAGVRRGTVRYSPGYRYNPRYGYSYRHPYRFGYGGYPYRWRGGFYVSYWDPYWYAAYSPLWLGGLPAFGFGTVYYGPTYASYFVEPRPVYVGEPPVVVVPGSNVAPLPPPPAPPPEPGVGEPAEEGAEEGAAFPAPATPGQAAFEAGLKAFQEGSFEEAKRRFQIAADAEPENGEAWMGLLQASFATGDYATAARGVAKAAELGGFPRGYRFDPRPAYPDAQRFEVALAALEEHRKANPDDADAHLVAAYFHVALGGRAEASQAVVDVLAHRPDDPTAPVLNEALLPPLPPEPPSEGRPPAVR